MSFQLGKKLAAFGSAFLALKVVNDTFDWVLYPLAIYWLGAYAGGALMIVLAFFLNYFLVLVYNRTQGDWLLLEWLGLQRDAEAKTWWGRLLRFWLRHASWVVVSYMSWGDPFKAFVYLRGRMPAGSRFTAADWRLLFGVNLLGNLIHIALVMGLLEAIKRLWHTIF